MFFYIINKVINSLDVFLFDYIYLYVYTLYIKSLSWFIKMFMKLTKKEKYFLRQLLGGHALSGLSSSYCEDDEKSFKEEFGVSFKFAEKALNKLKAELSK